jgi:hypothetical protein
MKTLLELHERHIRTTVPTLWARRIGHLAADTGRTKQELLREGVLLLLRYHGAAEGLPEPVQPVESDGGASFATGSLSGSAV